MTFATNKTPDAASTEGLAFPTTGLNLLSQVPAACRWSV